jgi:hypothetical protein
MSEEKNPITGYGYASDEMSFLGGKFGLNENCKIVGFAYNPKAGKDGADAEAMDLQILLPEEDEPRRMRVFPAGNVKYKDKNAGTEKVLVTVNDCKTNEERAAFQKAMTRVSGTITHIMKCFVPQEKYEQAIKQRPISSFKDLVMACGSMLPKNFKEIPIDAFLEYQWNSAFNQNGEEVVYLQFPFSTMSGAFLCPHVEHTEPWELHKNPNAGDLENAWWYTSKDATGAEVTHPFKRKGQYMNSNSAKNLKQRNGELENEAAVQSATEQGAATTTGTGEQQSTW